MGARGQCWRALAFSALCVIATGAVAQDEAAPQPLGLNDQSPTVAIYGLPRAHGYTVAPAGRWQSAFTLDFTSHYTSQHAGDERLLFDGETTRAALQFARGFGDGWQASIEIPFVDHSGGFADGFIDNFHDAFGFADGGRSDAPEDRQAFRYSRGSERVLDVDDSPSGLGDIRLGVKKRLAGVGDWGMAVAGEVKLPTGDASKLTGSGAADMALSAVVGNNQRGTSRWRLLAGAGGIYTGEGDVLAGQRVRAAAFGWATIGYAITPDFVLKTQASAHTPFYEDTRLEALDGTAVQGALGFDWRLFERAALSAAIVEDLNTGASPDVSFQLGLRQLF